MFAAGVPTLTSCATSVSPGLAKSDLARKTPRTGDYSSGLGPFATRLFDKVAPASTNCVLSPFSIVAVLAMIRNGAVGDTATQMDTVLGTPIADLNEELNSTLQALSAISQGPNKVTLKVANTLWGQRELSWKTDFLDALAAYYGAGMRTVDFRTQSAQVVDTINDWIKTETNGLIPKLVTSGMITNATRLVLANALYLKGNWRNPFDPKATRKEEFTTDNGTIVTVDMMNASFHTDGYQTSSWKAAGLRLTDPSLAMAAVLPTAPAAATGSLTDLIGADGLTRIFAGNPTSVVLSMPRWQARFNTQLKDTLSGLGMSAAFDPNLADFSGMTAQERLFLSFLVHEAVISVDENGVEAAATTVGGMAATSMPTDQLVLRLDRPFFYALVHVPTSTPLFIGRVGDPTRQG